MTHVDLIFLAAAIFIIAVLYSSVGHAGASGYIAVMALLGLSSSLIKPTALVLNLVVSIIATIHFYSAGHFSWKLFWPFALTSIPFAYLGGQLDLPIQYYKIFIGLVLFFSAFWLLKKPLQTKQGVNSPSITISLLIGIFLGFISGLVGVGGGIFLSPLLLLLNWANAKTTAAVSALFILVNSLSGLLGYMNAKGLNGVPSFIWILSISALAGGMFGAYFGSRRLPDLVIRRILSVVLFVAGLKLMLTG